MISDYCKGPGTPSETFAEYIKQRGYDLHDVEAYGQVYTFLYKCVTVILKIHDAIKILISLVNTDA